MITNASPTHINGQGECILRGKKGENIQNIL